MNKTSRHVLLGQAIMTVATLVYGLGPLIIDLTATHVFHPEWTPHARMHMVWLLGINTLIAFLSLYFLWLYKSIAFGVNLAGILGLCVYGSFMLSAFTSPLYGGSMGDEAGVPLVMGLDANIFGFSIALTLLLTGWFLIRKNDLYHAGH